MKQVKEAHAGAPGRRENRGQSKASLAVAFACVIAFMGLGLVDPILTSIAKQLHASMSQVELLFTSYITVTCVSMLISGYISSRIGPKKTLLIGLAVIVVFSALAGSSHSITEIVWFRAGWGLGNAMFIATALSVIIGVSTGGTAAAVMLFEAALGLGISVGPLVGGWLGGLSWRGPFYGVSALMAIGFVAIALLLPSIPKPARAISLLEPIKALRYRGLLTMGIMSLLFNIGFFTLLAYTPFVLHMSTHGLGYLFCGWGIMMAICSVFVAPRFERLVGTKMAIYSMFFLFAADLAVMGLVLSHHGSSILLLGTMVPARTILMFCVVVAGVFLGISDTVVTTAVMDVSPVDKSAASSAYNFVRFSGGAIAPWLASKLAGWFDPAFPFIFAAAAVLVAMIVLFSGRNHIGAYDDSMQATVIPLDPDLLHGVDTAPACAVGDCD